MPPKGFDNGHNDLFPTASIDSSHCSSEEKKHRKKNNNFSQIIVQYFIHI